MGVVMGVVCTDILFAHPRRKNSEVEEKPDISLLQGN